MIRTLLVLSVLSSALFSVQGFAASASCSGKVKNQKLFFFARGSLANKNDGSGFVKINDRVVAEFDGDAARINYLRRTFSIRNNRGDVVEGKLQNLRTGAAILTRMVLPGEGVRVTEAPVKCSMN